MRDIGLEIRSKEAIHLDIGRAISSLNADARTTFVCPPLNVRRFNTNTNMEADTDDAIEYSDEVIEIDELLRNEGDIVFISKREGGKTSLANHIAVLTCEGLTDKDRVPVLVDFHQFRKGRRGIIEDFNSYHRSSTLRADCGNLLDRGDLLILIDNVSLSDESDVRDLEKIIKEHKGNRFILLADSSHLFGDPNKANLSAFLRVVYIKPLPRKAIREISRRWAQIVNINDVEANAYIIRQVKENQLPRTGYIISLLIWAYQKQKKLEKINESYLLNAVLDSLLDKANFTKALRREFDPVSAEITLQEIALFLREKSGVSSSNELLAFVIGFFERKALSFDAADVINQLVDCRILEKKGTTIQFNYKCFQEFFIACHLRLNNRLLTDIVANRAHEYGRELYLLSGLRRQNNDLLEGLRNRLNQRTPSVLKEISSSDFDSVSKQSVFDPATRKKLTAIKTKKMTANQVDDLLDAAEKEIDSTHQDSRHQGEPRNVRRDTRQTVEYKGDISSISDYMEEMSLYGSIVKNSEFDDGDVKAEALTYYSDNMARFVVYMTRVMNDLLQRFFADNPIGDRRDPNKSLPTYEADAIRAKMTLVMHRVLVMIITIKMSEDLATEKLAVTYNRLVSSNDLTPELRLFFALIMYDVNTPGWDDTLRAMIDENSSPFMLDLVAERLWHDLYTRYESEGRRAKISKVVDHLMAKIDPSASRQRTSRQAIDRAAAITQVRGGI